MNLKKDALWNTIGNFSYLGALWFMSILVVRIGDFEKAGFFSLALTNANIYISLASYTVRLFYAADIQENYKDNQYFLMRLITTGISILLCFTGSILIGYSKYQITIIILFYLYKTGEMISDIIFGALQRRGKLYLSGYSLVLKSMFSLLAFSMVLYFTQSLVYAMVTLDIVALLILFCMDIPIARKAGIKLIPLTKIDVRNAFKLMIICLPLFVVGLCYNIIPSIPRLAFERIYTAEQFGVYSSISTITVLISTAVNCIAVPFVPKFAEYYYRNDRKSLRKITVISVVSVLLVGLVALIGAQFAGEWILVLLFGSKMVGYVNVFQWIIMATVFTSIIICLNDFFVAVEQQRILLYGCVTGAVICALLAVPLCKKFYMNGVAYNLIISQAVEVGILFWGVHKILQKMDKN